MCLCMFVCVSVSLCGCISVCLCMFVRVSVRLSMSMSVSIRVSMNMSMSRSINVSVNECLCIAKQKIFRFEKRLSIFLEPVSAYFVYFINFLRCLFSSIVCRYIAPPPPPALPSTLPVFLRCCSGYFRKILLVILYFVFSLHFFSVLSFQDLQLEKGSKIYFFPLENETLLPLN